MKTDKNIAVIIPYFGRLPWYFDYFAHSCGYNPGIHFIIITDDQYSKKTPSNVLIVNQTFRDIKNLIGHKLQIAATFDDPYKLCDFRPAYGVIFEDMLKGYAFWGHGDIDVVFGNIGNFISDEMLEEFDIISMREDYLLGCFCLFKNTHKVNTLYTLSRDYVKIFTNPKHYCFDETNFCYEEFEKDIHYSKINSEIESMTHLVKKLNEQKVIKAYFDFHVIEGLPGELNWINGTLTYKDKWEAVLYHLIKLKTIFTPSVIPEKMPDSFLITTTEIIN